jgi:HAD superfamily hydrolase (TIGR01509 family)
LVRAEDRASTDIAMTILRSKQAAIFDIDGTLIDSRAAHLSSWQQVLAEAGLDVPLERLRSLFGKHSDEWVRELLPPERQSEGPAIVRRKNEVFAAHLDELHPFPKARELLRAVKGAGILLGFATGATKAELEHHLRVLDAGKLADATAYDREVRSGKPAPDIYALTVQRLGVEPGSAIAIGDGLYDVLSARAAGMPCIALLTGGFSESNLRSAGAAEVYPTIAELYAAFIAAR